MLTFKRIEISQKKFVEGNELYSKKSLRILPKLFNKSYKQHRTYYAAYIY